MDKENIRLIELIQNVRRKRKARQLFRFRWRLVFGEEFPEEFPQFAPTHVIINGERRRLQWNDIWPDKEE